MAIDWPVKDVYVKYLIRRDLAFQRNQQRQRYFSHTYGVVDGADTKSHSQPLAEYAERPGVSSRLRFYAQPCCLEAEVRHQSDAASVSAKHPLVFVEVRITPDT